MACDEQAIHLKSVDTERQQTRLDSFSFADFALRVNSPLLGLGQNGV